MISTLTEVIRHKEAGERSPMYREFPELTKEQETELLTRLREDILERYNNIEWWDSEIIFDFKVELGIYCHECGSEECEPDCSTRCPFDGTKLEIRMVDIDNHTLEECGVCLKCGYTESSFLNTFKGVG